MSFEYKEGFNEAWIDKIIELHNKTEMKRSPDFKEKLIKAYTNRYLVITCWKKERLVGFGTMISDGAMYSSIFDLVIDPEYQRKGIGKEIVNKLLSKVSDTCIFLTSTAGNEEFYKKIGFKRHKTAFAKYPWKSDYLE